MDNNFNFGDDDLFSDNQNNQSSDVDDIFNNANSASGDNDNLDFGDFSDNNDVPDDSTKLKKTSIIAMVVGLVAILAIILIASLIGKSRNKDDEITYVPSTNNTYVDPNQLMNTQGNSYNTQTVTDKYSEWTELEQSQEIEFKDYVKTAFTITGIKHYVRNSSPDGTFIIKTTLTGMLSGYSGTYTLDVPYDKGVILDTNPDLGIGSTFDVSVLVGEYNGKLFIGDITTNIYE